MKFKSVNNIIRDCETSSSNNTYNIGRFRQLIFDELTQETFNTFCIEVLRLAYHHQVSIDKWCTESPEDFRNSDTLFYRLTFETRADDLVDMPGWPMIHQARLADSVFSRYIFFENILMLGPIGFDAFCRTIRLLVHHRALVDSFWFTNEPEKAISNIVNDREDLLFQLRGINRGSFLPFEQ